MSLSVFCILCALERFLTTTIAVTKKSAKTQLRVCSATRLSFCKQFYLVIVNKAAKPPNRYTTDLSTMSEQSATTAKRNNLPFVTTCPKKQCVLLLVPHPETSPLSGLMCTYGRRAVEDCIKRHEVPLVTDKLYEDIKRIIGHKQAIDA